MNVDLGEQKRAKLFTKLYSGNSGCLHLENYIIQDEFMQRYCGPEYYRDGYQTEFPGRMTVKSYQGLFGAPMIDPQTQAHAEIYVGFIFPEPGEPLKQFRRRQNRVSAPVAKLYPFASALWKLIGYQPPLARVLILFAQGMNEYDISRELGLSVYNVQNRLGKGARVAQQFLRT